MGLNAIIEAKETLEKYKVSFSEREKEFVVQFAYKSQDKELTEALIRELCEPDKEVDKIIRMYTAILNKNPEWISQIENVLVALEMYRIEEGKAIQQISDILHAHEVDMSKEEVKEKDTEQICCQYRKDAVL